MKPEPYVLLSLGGLALFLFSFTHRIPAFAEWDVAVFKRLNAINQGRLRVGLFRLIWPLGTTVFTVLALLALIVFDPPMGLLASLSLFCAGVVERITKQKIQRVRPFAVLANIPMHQPSRPEDASFPSGDCLRVWFLATLLVFLFPWSWPPVLVILGLACLVTMGRIALGVHYPLDVLGGAGLGILAAGVCLVVTNFSMPR